MAGFEGAVASRPVEMSVLAICCDIQANCWSRSWPLHVSLSFSTHISNRQLVVTVTFHDVIDAFDAASST